MSKSKQIISLIFKAILIIIAGYGMMDNFGSGRWYGFNYYTVLSNAVVLIYFVCSFAWGVNQMRLGTKKITWAPRIQGAVTFTITVTFLIYMFLLAPADIANGKFWNFHNMAVHYIVPIMAIVDWFVFGMRGRLSITDPLRWLGIPIVYFAFILIRAPLFGNIGPLGTPYPYGFIDAQKYGWMHVGTNAVFILVALLILGYLFYFIDTYRSRRIQK